MREVAGDVTATTRRRASVSAIRPRLRTTAVALFALLTCLAFAGPALATPSTTVSLTFDDGRPSQMAAEQQLVSRGMVATFYIISAQVGQPGVMTLADLNSLEADGMEIGGHTVLHPNLPSLASDEVGREVCFGRNWLMDRGFDVYDLAYPYDSTNAGVEAAVAACGYNSARSGGQLQCDSGHACAETMPPLDAYSLRAPNDFNQSTTLAQMKAMVTNAESHGGGWVPLELHDVCDGPGDPLLPPDAQCPAPDVITRALYTQFLDWLKGEVDAGRVQVKTVHDVIGGALRPQVALDPVPVRTGNLLLNPSFEQASTTGGPSSCFANISNGPDHAPVITTTSDAHDGAKALAISVPAAYDSWAYNLIAPVPDLGQCAPTAIAGHNYAFTGWYKGNGQIRVVAYWRNADYQWARLDWGAPGTATFPAAATWTKAALTFRAPTGATAVSAGFYVDGTAVDRSAGNSYVIDDQSLVDAGPSHALTLARAGSGSGAVTSSPAGIACGATCSASLANGTTVTLTAVPAADSTFTGWSGACGGTSATCTLAMTRDLAATATFTVKAALQVIRAGTGSGAVSGSAAGIACGVTCSASLASGATVTLTAVASPGSSFSGWSGACSGASSTCMFTITSDRTATATFVADAALAVDLAGSGHGAVSGDGASGIDCGDTCDQSFVNGAIVTLTAVAAPGSTFAGWSGACSGFAATCTLAMTRDLTVTATFALNPVLSVLKAGSGSGSVSSSLAGIDCAVGCSEQAAAYAPGTIVTLTAIAADGSTFAGWSDASCAGSATCAFSLDGARTVTATFSVNPPAPAPASGMDAGATPPVLVAAPVVPAPAAARPRVLVVAKTRPALRTRPRVTGGARAGRTLVCMRGTWTGSPTRYVFTWRRDGTFVVGHGSAYRLRAADRGHSIRCAVTAANAKGATTVVSSAVRVRR